MVSQDGIGTINMVVLGKGELNRGRVSADIRAGHTDSGWRCHPQRHGPASQTQFSLLLIQSSVAAMCCVMHNAHWQKPRQAGSTVAHSPLAVHQGAARPAGPLPTFWCAAGCALSGCRVAFDGLRSDSSVSCCSTTIVTLWVDSLMTATYGAPGPGMPRNCK